MAAEQGAARASDECPICGGVLFHRDGCSREREREAALLTPQERLRMRVQFAELKEEAMRRGES